MEFISSVLDALNKYGISAALILIIAALMYFIWRMYKGYNKIHQDYNQNLLNIIDKNNSVIERNNNTINDLKTSIDLNTEATKASVASMTSAKDLITSILVKSMQGNDLTKNG